MTGLTDFITNEHWSDIATIWYVLVDDAYRKLENHFGKWRKRGTPPVFSDSEVITVGLLIDTFFDGHEEKGLCFIRQFQHPLFPKLLPNGQFNYRRRLLGPIMEQIRRLLVATWGLISPDDQLALVDSAPIPVCTYKRSSRNTNFVGPEYFGKMYTRAARLFGLRLHLNVSAEQVVASWLLAPASHHDSQLMWPLFEEQQQLVILGDGAYVSPIEHSRLLSKREIKVYAPPRRDSQHPWPSEFKQLAMKVRRRVETAISVLSSVFKVEQIGSRSTDGLVTRVSTRILAYTLCFITNLILDGAV